jgi:hypothetical protein
MTDAGKARYLPDPCIQKVVVADHPVSTCIYVLVLLHLRRAAARGSLIRHTRHQASGHGLAWCNANDAARVFLE